jgi:hypothetical protein
MFAPAPRSAVPARPRRRVGAVVAVATLALVGQLLGLAHLFLIEHARCPEHGDTVHVRRGSEDGHADAAAPTTGYALAGADGDVRPGDAADHGDDHCQLWTERRDRAPVLTGLSTPMPSYAALDAIVPGVAPAPPRPLFHLAPKAGPPAA